MLDFTNKNFTRLEHITGIREITTSTGTILVFCAAKPIKDMTIATTPQEKPFIKPPIILLYCGKTFCAKFIVIGVANIVTNPINANITNDKTIVKTN